MATAETPSSLDAFIARWSSAAASERANAQLFLTELADLLGVPRPGNDHADGYTFEFPVKIPTGPDTSTEGRIDLYRRACFVLEAKQFAAPKVETSELALALDPVAGKQTPSLPDARPRSDRFRCGGRECKFLAVVSGNESQ